MPVWHLDYLMWTLVLWWQEELVVFLRHQMTVLMRSLREFLHGNIYCPDSLTFDILDPVSSLTKQTWIPAASELDFLINRYFSYYSSWNIKTNTV